MSVPSQQVSVPSNGKKSSNSSVVNTPASTPITHLSNGNATQGSAQNSPPPNNNAPKYGTLVPNRIFVGGISANTTEGELLSLFSSYGTVKAAKIIQDRAGVSKGYGFITFESEDDARKPLSEAENIVLRERKLNIAPAIKKQLFSRAFDASSPPAVAAAAAAAAVAAGNHAQFFFPPAAAAAATAMPYFQGGVAYYPQPAPPAPGDPTNQAPAVYQRRFDKVGAAPNVYPAQTGPQQANAYPPLMYPAQPFYMPQQYTMPMPFDFNYYHHPHQNGGGGGGGGAYLAQSAPSNSPSRGPPPLCYNQPMYNGGSTPAGSAPTTTATPDTMLYNMQMYPANAPMDPSQPFYSTEAFDLANYNEDAYLVDNHAVTPPQDLMGVVEMQPPTVAILHHPDEPVSIVNFLHLPPPQIVLAQQRQLASSVSPPSSASSSVKPSPPPQITSSTTQHRPPSREPDTTRNSNTPVVSLLSLERQQERDYNSMQGGRRPKVLAPPNGYFEAPPPMYCQNGFNRKPRRQFPVQNGRSTDSSLRTESNSSASQADDSKTPPMATPPPPLQPLMASYRLPGRGFHNNNGNNRVQPAHRYAFQAHARFAPPPLQTTHAPPPGRKFQHYNNNSISTVNFKRSTDLNANSDSQANHHHHYGGVVGHAYNGNLRRSRKSIRRGGASNGEGGGGDAPNASNDASDVGKRFDSLKL